VANVCLKPARGPEFLDLLSTMAREFLDARLPLADAATVFLEHHAGPAGVEKLKKAYAEATPDGPAAGAEAAVLAVPSGEAGDAVREMAAAACPGVGFAAAAAADDVVIYRERPRVPLAELPRPGQGRPGGVRGAVEVRRRPAARAGRCGLAPVMLWVGGAGF
jgi:hypothetical protein